MYCPHCGRVMSVVGDGGYACANGIEFSRNLHDTLTERFPTRTPRRPDAEVGKRFGRWYCPGCGVPLGPGMVCRSCGESIQDLLFPLVELHPHEDEPTRR